MSYYDTIEEDLKRAKEILERGKEPTRFAERLAAEWGDAPVGGTIFGADIYAAYKLLESFVAEIERLQAEHTRAVLHYTFKGYMAGENVDARHWRERAENAEAEIERLRAQLQQFYGLFSDYEDPCQSFDQAEAIWNAMKAREEGLYKQRREHEAEIERLRAAPR